MRNTAPKHMLPTISSGAERQSFEVHLGRRAAAVRTVAINRQQVLKLARKYVTLTGGARTVHTDFATCWDHAIQTLNPSSGPGYPLSKDYGTVADVLKDQAMFMKIKIYVRAWFKACLSGLDVTHDFEKVRVFIKREHHKPEKCAEGRWRLISNLPLVRTIMGAIVCGPLDTTEHQLVHQLPIKVGLSDQDGEFIDAMLSVTTDDPDFVVLGSDASCHDWTLPGVTFAFNQLVRIMHAPQMKDLIKSYYKGLTTATFCDSQFNDLPKPSQPIQLSGHKGTLSDNSRCRWLYHQLAAESLGCAGDTKIIALGDDSLERVPRDKVQGFCDYYTSLGFKMKNEISEDGYGIDFCSRVLEKTPNGLVCRFTSVRRQCTRLLEVSLPAKASDALYSAAYNWCHDDEAFEYLALLYLVYFRKKLERDFFRWRTCGRHWTGPRVAGAFSVPRKRRRLVAPPPATC